MNTIEIWQPRYKDGIVLVAKYKVGVNNRIIFTKAKHLEGKVYKMAGAKLEKYPIETNGRIPCYAVPLEDFDVEDAKTTELSDCCNAPVSFGVCLNCGRKL